MEIELDQSRKKIRESFISEDQIQFDDRENCGGCQFLVEKITAFEKVVVNEYDYLCHVVQDAVRKYEKDSIENSTASTNKVDDLLKNFNFKFEAQQKQIDTQQKQIDELLKKDTLRTKNEAVELFQRVIQDLNEQHNLKDTAALQVRPFIEHNRDLRVARCHFLLKADSREVNLFKHRYMLNKFKAMSQDVRDCIDSLCSPSLIPEIQLFLETFLVDKESADISPEEEYSVARFWNDC